MWNALPHTSPSRSNNPPAHAHTSTETAAFGHDRAALNLMGGTHFGRAILRSHSSVRAGRGRVRYCMRYRVQLLRIRYQQPSKPIAISAMNKNISLPQKRSGMILQFLPFLPGTAARALPSPVSCSFVTSCKEASVCLHPSGFSPDCPGLAPSPSATSARLLGFFFFFA